MIIFFSRGNREKRGAALNVQKLRHMPGHFSVAPDGIKVRIHAFHTVFGPYDNSWGTMVTLQTPRNSAAKETSLLIPSRFL